MTHEFKTPIATISAAIEAIKNFKPDILIVFGSVGISLGQKYAFIDVQYILKEMPEYTNAQKEIDKLIHNWEDVGIRVEKARWGRFNVLKGKIKIELPKTTDIDKITKEEAVKMIEAKAPKKKTVKKKTAKKK